MDETRNPSSFYSCHVLPNGTTSDRGDRNALIAFLADKYTALRVAGLKQSPQSFSATLDGELRLTLPEKLKRIQQHNKHILVVVKQSSGSASSGNPWYDSPWVGQATLFGPMRWEEYIAPLQSIPLPEALTDDQIQLLAGVHGQQSPRTKLGTAFWHMTALYIDVTHRRLGLAKKLCLAAFEHIKNESVAKGYQSALLRIIIKPTNTVVVDMYRSLGFDIVEGPRATLAEATKCAEDTDSLPADYREQAAYMGRGGLFMLKHIDLAQEREGS
ncbi:hypothetical protein H2198_002810 [Neophaeococcomyces mojaviensis]|uniref:Uncharacterized protein n=1 Tax=Neophaeococcomyces mojaviensis TaxID=3383035 RepID=A0ACC3ADS5_9EURO|nr:hypothetical protein H2198_002810 [Knufia sp. JES_112]